jgi:hypothetical protein
MTNLDSRERDCGKAESRTASDVVFLRRPYLYVARAEKNEPRSNP